MKCFLPHRPMYIDSTNYVIPDGEQPVARELRKYVEPLLYVIFLPTYCITETVIAMLQHV